jgi:hypothetical protein
MMIHARHCWPNAIEAKSHGPAAEDGTGFQSDMQMSERELQRPRTA